jgi:hypothetical protein
VIPAASDEARANSAQTHYHSCSYHSAKKSGNFNEGLQEYPMYQDEYGRIWQGPFPFTAAEIESHAPQTTGIYMLLVGGNLAAAREVYVGIATKGNTIQNRLRAHHRGDGSWALSQRVNPALYSFVCFPCDDDTSRQIESYVTSTKKPPFNIKVERANYIPNITVH